MRSTLGPLDQHGKTSYRVYFKTNESIHSTYTKGVGRGRTSPSTFFEQFESPSEKLKAFALYYIWLDARVPYFKLDAGIKMSNDEYIKIRQNMLNDIKKQDLS